MSLLIAAIVALQAAAAGADPWPPEGFYVRNLTTPYFGKMSGTKLPVKVEPFVEHVRNYAFAPPAGDAANANALFVNPDGTLRIATDSPGHFEGHTILAAMKIGAATWLGTDGGLYTREAPEKPYKRHESYGVDGPLATKITALAVGAKDTLWVGTPLGLSAMSADGQWRHVRATEGMPVEEVTALAADADGNLWIGTPQGAIFYKPEAEGRQWFYRAGKRYLPDDRVRAIAIAPAGKSVYFLTAGGVGQIEIKTTTLLDRAQAIEKRVNERHRRQGMVAACVLDNAENPTAHEIHDNDNDGLWTAYHVAAMSLCYGATKDAAAKASAREGMHALYMLQNASGTPGLVARSVVPPEIGEKKDAQWRLTPDGKMYWKSDTSSDEIDGHYLAFYTYFEHIAKDDAAERELIVKQVRALTDYLLDHDYQLIDWNGKRTTWGFWDPRSLNRDLRHYAELGLNSLQMLSFLKVAHYLTGDQKYDAHYRKLIVEHHYLENTLLTKRSWPEENNHSDDQLGFVAWYPILQLEKNAALRFVLRNGVHRHYEVVRPEQPSFYTFVYATVDPGGADIAGAVENLRQIPTDRRTWAQINSKRADVELSPYANRFDRPVLTRALPADERCFEKWNADPYVPDNGGDGRYEDDGAAYLLPYWMGRYHGFIAGP